MVMNCYYHIDKLKGKILIPGCMAVVISDDIDDCTCIRFKKIKKSSRYKLIDILWEVKEGKINPNKAYKKIIELHIK